MNLGGDTTQPSTAFIKGYSGVHQHLLQRDLPAFLSHFSKEVINWFTHDLKYLLNIYYVTATFLSIEDTAMGRISPHFMALLLDRGNLTPVWYETMAAFQENQGVRTPRFHTWPQNLLIMASTTFD